MHSRKVIAFRPHEHAGLNRDFSPGIYLLLGAATARQKRQTAARANLNKPAFPASFLLLATPPSKLLSRLNAKCWKRKSSQFQGVSRQRYLAIHKQSEGKPHCPTACLSSSTARLKNWTRHQFFVLWQEKAADMGCLSASWNVAPRSHNPLSHILVATNLIRTRCRLAVFIGAALLLQACPCGAQLTRFWMRQVLPPNHPYLAHALPEGNRLQTS